MTARQATHVRILVLDASGRLLLAKRRDPASGRLVWEPPGGAIEIGESRVGAAERELLEETGIAASLDRSAWWERVRSYTWKGEDRVRAEALCTVRVGEVAIRPQMPTEEERDTFLEWRWIGEHELGLLDAPCYPSDPFALLASPATASGPDGSQQG